MKICDVYNSAKNLSESDLSEPCSGIYTLLNRKF